MEDHYLAVDEHRRRAAAAAAAGDDNYLDIRYARNREVRCVTFESIRIPLDLLAWLWRFRVMTRIADGAGPRGG